MEFFLYLSPQGQQLVRDLISAKFHIHENIGLCRNKDTFGYADLPNKFVICTKNIKNSGFDPNHYIEETVNHEAVHAAQICKKDKTMTLGIPKKDMHLPWNKIQDVKNSVKIVKNQNIFHREYEAYYLEDKPEKVRYYVRKFCF
jgi:hypothetical protein